MAPDSTGGYEAAHPAERRYLVACEDCDYAEEVGGIDAAEAAALEHEETSGHALLAVEIPGMA